MFPRNYWYVAAWDHEVRRQELSRRTICNEPIVFYRTEDGTPVALEIAVVTGICRCPMAICAETMWNVSIMG